VILVLGFAALAGVLSILAPCTLAVVPVVLGAAGARGSRIRLAGVFIGFATTFVVATVLLAAALAGLGVSTAGLRLFAAAVIAVAGLSLAVPALGSVLDRTLGALGPAPRPLGEPPRGGMVGGLALGSALGLIWAPCVGPIMAAVIATAAVTGPSPAALLIASAYVAGAVLPLAAIAVWGRRLIDGRRTTGRGARRIAGFAMAIAGIVVLTGLDVPLSARIAAVLPAGLTQDLIAIERQPTIDEELRVLRPSPTGVDARVPLEDFGPAPELTGISDWINSPPLTLAGLRGKVVLVEFWTFACSNCQNVQPYVKAWYERYAADGLEILGLHTPELSFERNIDNVRSAVSSAGLRYPIAVDPEYATWNAFGNRYWPAFYFIDKAGRIRHVHYGEGDYDGSEAVIRQLLAEPA